MKSKKGKVFITGSSGFIGSYLVNALTQRGWGVIGIDICPPKITPRDYEFKLCDILDAHKLKEVLSYYEPSAVVHLAARADLDEKKDIRSYAANIDGVQNLIDAIKATPTVERCIYTSTQMVCKPGYVPNTEYDYFPHTIYGQSKVLTEKIVRETDGAGVTWCLVRPTTIWGPGMSAHYQRFLRMIQKGIYFHVGNRPLYKSFGYVGNSAYQFIRILEAPKNIIHQRLFYIADYTPLSIRAWANALQHELSDKPLHSVPENVALFLAKIGDIINWMGIKKFPFNSFRLSNILTEYQFDLSATKAVCGDLPYTIDEGVKETVQWFQNKR